MLDGLTTFINEVPHGVILRKSIGVFQKIIQSAEIRSYLQTKFRKTNQ